MKIRRLTMHNFGVYAGTNTFDFVGDKPIVLIGGLNGRGKTTFLEAVLLSLYGANSFAYKESSFKSYGQYLKSFVNKSDETMSSFLELEFQMNDVDSDVYMIRRKWEDQPKKRTTEVLYVEKNGVESEFLTENWPMFIEDILPSALSNFFFFDGEKIAKLAVDNTNDQLKESIRAMLGISILDTLRGDLTKNIKRIEKTKDEEDEIAKVNVLREVKEEAENALKAIDNEIQEVEEKLANVKNKIEQKKGEYAAKGGDVIGKRDELLSKKATIEANRHQVDDRMIALASAELPLALVKDLVDKISAQAEIEHNAVINQQANVRLNELVKTFSEMGNNVSGLEAFINFVNNEADNDSVENIYDLSDVARVQSKQLSSNRISDSVATVVENFTEKSRLDSELDEIDNYLSIDINEDDLNQIYRKILKLKKEEAELSVDLESLNQKRSTANGTMIKATSEFNKKVTAYLNRVEANDDADRSLKYTEMAIQVLDRYSIRLQEKKTDALANTITACYKKLANKKNLIERIAMDPVSLDLSYLDKNDNEVDKASLSAGEEQLMVISILWALAICSKKKLPVIIDTPLSRLDSNHRKSLIQVYFPKASDQTIILSTDSEIDEKYYELMKHDVGDEFTLDYCDETKSTSIQRGYFVGGEE
ncbi:DNA sulfur modification protein DndD [Lachnospiraceae bacterium XBD2001]|nr:DNA sulfur modification protein DndD [Lachnospiraceae bacterium XBD2001]